MGDMTPSEPSEKPASLEAPASASDMTPLGMSEPSGKPASSEASVSAASDVAPLETTEPSGPLVDCPKLEITRCEAANDVCEWKREGRSSNGIFGMSSLQKKSCHFVE